MSDPKGYFHQVYHNPSTGQLVKVTAYNRSGPYDVRLFDKNGHEVSNKHSRLKTLPSAIKWTEKILGMSVKEGALHTSEADSLTERRRQSK